MKKLSTTIKVKILSIEVDSRFYTIDYTISFDGKKATKGEYSSDYDNGMSPLQWKKYLENGQALEDVLQNTFS